MLYSKEPEEPGTYWSNFADTRDTFQFTPSNIYNSARTDTMGLNYLATISPANHTSPKKAASTSSASRARSGLSAFSAPK